MQVWGWSQAEVNQQPQGWCMSVCPFPQPRSQALSLSMWDLNPCVSLFIFTILLGRNGHTVPIIIHVQGLEPLDKLTHKKKMWESYVPGKEVKLAGWALPLSHICLLGIHPTLTAHPLCSGWARATWLPLRIGWKRWWVGVVRHRPPLPPILQSTFHPKVAEVKCELCGLCILLRSVFR